MYKIFENLMADHGVTAYKVSKETGIATSTLSDWKNGRSTPKQDKLQKIADYFNVSLDYLVGNSEFKTTQKENENSTAYIKNSIENNFPIIPDQFTNPEEARTYVMKHQIFAYGGFYPEKMSDEDILNFANEMIHQAELIGYKYKSKNK